MWSTCYYPSSHDSVKHGYLFDGSHVFRIPRGFDTERMTVSICLRGYHVDRFLDLPGQREEGPHDCVFQSTGEWRSPAHRWWLFPDLQFRRPERVRGVRLSRPFEHPLHEGGGCEVDANYGLTCSPATWTHVTLVVSPLDQESGECRKSLHTIYINGKPLFNFFAPHCLSKVSGPFLASP